MSGEFPPRSTHINQIETLLIFLKGIIPDQKAIYVTSPITSGRRYIEWIKLHPENRVFSGDNQNPEFVTNVIEVNRKHAKSVIQKIRTLFPNKVVIDPTAVPDISGWNQGDYRYAWGKIIEQYTETLVLSNDWQFSCGSIYEFLIGKRLNIKVLDENQQKMSLDRGLQLITEATDLMQFYNLSTAFHEAIYLELTGRKTVDILA